MDTPSCKMPDFAVEAYSSTCVRDQCDRPMFGALNICPETLSLDPADTYRQISMIIHEFLHMLGFSSSLFRYFRNSDGTPKLPRDPRDPSRVLGEISWSCTSAQNWMF